MSKSMLEAALEQMPHLKGRLVKEAALARLSWFRTGGPAEVLFEPADEADLATFLRHLPGSVPITVIGVGSNLLVRDGGVDGVVIRLGRSFSEIKVRGQALKAGAAAMDVHVAKAAQKHGLTGMAFLVGVPGTIGGALRMNAGAYGRAVEDVLTHARAIDRFGHIHEIDLEAFGFTYRHCSLDPDLIFLNASFILENDAAAEIQREMDAIIDERKNSQPIGTQTGGSTFKNPEGHHAWKLIDEAGCRGKRIGNAQVSEKHTNFLINLGGATATDIEMLGEEVRAQVKDKFGVSLEWEIKRIGKPPVEAKS
ncbi:MAG: UDP-N-acetylenolpyruvoylglucosamine reductase [Kordiimonadales bacterium]|nr:MAG: UDP-N-acetylenolpyruvoylglucosamine reductase [Kordiimonadales bacterium]